MAAFLSHAGDEPDPTRVVTRRDFARELTGVRELAGRSVRDLARDLTMPASTLGGYFSGAHLPALSPPSQLEAVLRACGVTDESALRQWHQALRRARRTTGESPVDRAVHQHPTDHHPDQPSQPPASLHDPGLTPAVSTRPPVQRLAGEPQLRGRADVLDLLTAGLDPADPAAGTPRVHVLHGLGGCGKSMIALELARRGVDRGVRTWWISAADPGTAAAGMQAIAVELGATPDQLRLGSSPDQLWRLLAGLAEPWLLIIDNADDPVRALALPGDAVGDATGWLRPIPGPYGLAVVTTRDGSEATWSAAFTRWVHRHSISPLNSIDGALVLGELAGTPAGSVDAAGRLSERLGGLPLALRLAGRYLGEAASIPPGLADAAGVRTFEAYRDALDQGRHSELFGDPPDAPDGPEPGRHDRHARELIGRTWELSLDLLDARGVTLARPLLRLLSCLRPNPIPYGLVLQPGIMAASPLFTGLTGRRMWTVIRALASLSLVELQYDATADPLVADTLVMHPLVRDTSRHHQQLDGHPHRYLDLVTALLTELVRDLDPRNPTSWARWRALAEHCASPLDLVREQGLAPRDTPPEVLGPATHAARYLRAAGELPRAEQEYTTLVETGRALLGRDHPDVLALQHDLCRVWYDGGQYNRAKRGFHTVLATRRRVLGPDHPDTLTTGHYLARALRDHGQLDEAQRYFTEVLDARRRVLGRAHPDTLTSLNNVADVLRDRGDFDRARRGLEEVHAVRCRILGPEHPATLVTRHHLATLTHDRDDLALAETQFAELLDTYERALGPNHPRSLTTKQSLTDVWHDLGRIEDARRLGQELLDARHRVLGDHHPATLTTRHRLGLLLVDAGRPDEAERELESVLDARLRVLGARHPDTVQTRESLDALRRQRKRSGDD
jgi:tetratricopeptide (TPR) repeat protein